MGFRSRDHKKLNERIKNCNPIKHFTSEALNVENIISYGDFIEQYHSPNNFARSNFGNVTKRSPEENYRVYARECHNFGNCRRVTPPDEILHPRNDPGCPDQDASAEVWDYGTGDSLDVTISGRTIILESDVSGSLVLNALAHKNRPRFTKSIVTPLKVRLY